MKKCNACQCIVDEKSECPICGNTLTYEPPCSEYSEHIAFNKYYVVYLLKSAWFSILCTLICGVLLIISKTLSVGHLVIGIIFLIASYLFSIFQRRYEQVISQWSFAEAYYKRKAAAAKYATGSAALIYFILAVI